MPKNSQVRFPSAFVRPVRKRHLLWLGCLLSFLFLTALAAAQTDPPKPDPATELRVLVETFLTATDPKEQTKLLKEIEVLSKGDPTLVATAIKDARTWKQDVAPEGLLALPNLSSWPADAQPKVAYILPIDYAVERKYPVTIILTSRKHADWMHATRDQFDPPPSIAVLLNPDHGAALADGAAWAELTSTILRATARQFPIDEHRIYLIADEKLAPAAWSILFSSADRFAGAMIHEGFPDLPYPAHSYPLFIQNLRHTAVLVHELLADSPPPIESTEPLPVGSPQLRALESLAAKDGIPLKVLRTATNDVSGRAWRMEAQALLDRPRPVQVSKISHWFSHPAQGSAGWLRATAIDGQPWDAQQVSILPKADTDRDAFITEFFREHLAHFTGEITGNTITIQTHRCAEIEICLAADMIDWTRPLTVMLNGIKRHDAIVSPNIKTMLQSARDGFLAHPIRAVLSFELHNDAPHRGKKYLPERSKRP